MWKTIYRTEIKDGWGWIVPELIWECGIPEADLWPLSALDLPTIHGMIDVEAINEAASDLAKMTKNDKRWDIISEAIEILEKSFMERINVEGSRIPTKEQPGTAS